MKSGSQYSLEIWHGQRLNLMFQLKRRPKAMSYSSFSLWLKDPDEFFIRYLAGEKATRLPQETFMSVGASFDAYAKAELHAAIFGHDGGGKFSFDTLFTDQVEAHNRDWAREAGKYVLDAYKYSGSYDEILALLKTAIEPPVFETTVEGVLSGVPSTGKPDLRWVAQFPGHDPVRIIFDFKVKGFCSKYGASPSQGYALCRDGYDFRPEKLNKTKAAPDGKPSGSHGTQHDKYLAYNHRGLIINEGYMETCNDEYADQVSLYGWLLGEKPGDENVVVWIDETVSKFREGQYPLLRIANHRARVSRQHQLDLLDKWTKCWAAITSGHVFVEMTREENDAHCEMLESMAAGLKTDGSAEEKWFNEVTRPQFRK